MADIIFEHALDEFIAATITRTWNIYWDDLVYEVKRAGPQCDESDIKESLDRLVKAKVIKPWNGGWAHARLTRADLRRWCD